MHVNREIDRRTRAERTPDEWLPVGAQVAEFVNNRAKRDDIIGFLGEGAGHGAAACFAPSIAEIELDVARCFGELTKPNAIGNINDRETLFDHPAAAGALIHESAHARWSTLEDLMAAHEWTNKDKKDPRIPAIVADFEESRIESLACETWPDDIPFLRACAMDIIMSEINVEELEKANPFQMGHLLLLTLAREDAGVLAAEDVDVLRELAIKFFTKEIYDKLRHLWIDAQEIRPAFRKSDDGYEVVSIWDQMVPLAEEWLSLLPEDPNEEQEAMMAGAGVGVIIIEMDESAAIGGQDDADDQETFESNAATAKEQIAVGKEIKDHEDVAEEVFGKGTAAISPRGTRSQVKERRPPTNEERAAAVSIGRDLEKARYRDRVEIESASRMPPGRLHTQAAVTEMAQQDQGMVVTAEPWKRIERRQTEDPNLTMGVMVDISGSMTRAMEPMGVTAYVMAEAGYRIQAQVAQVYFGNSVFPTLRPGQRMPEVIIRSSPDGTEMFDQAFKALDGQLNLLHGSGARLLVVCSDTCYTYDEDLACRKWIGRCVAAGVGVLMLPYDNGYHVMEKGFPKQVQMITHTMDPPAAARAIGQAAIKALETASAGR